MLSTLRRWLHRDRGEQSTAFLTECVRQLEADVVEIQQAELKRAAEHAAMIDQLDRLYKRMSARIARERPPSDADTGESPLALRQRLGR